MEYIKEISVEKKINTHIQNKMEPLYSPTPQTSNIDNK